MSYESQSIKAKLRDAIYSLAALLMVGVMACAKTEGTAAANDTGGTASSTVASSNTACAGNNGGLTLPPGFCATVFADTIGHPRHIVVNSNGDVYVNTWSGKYYTTPAPPGGFLVALRDTSKDGVADVVKRFGPDSAHGSGGGTGIGIYKGSLYAEQFGPSSAKIVRYAISADSMTPTSTPETIVSGLPVSGDHPMHPFAIGQAGDMYMDLGSSSNSCQVKNRTLESTGKKPCTELLTRAG